MDDWDVRAHEPTREGVDERSTGAMTAAAFVAPWVLLSLALPGEHRWRALALLGLLGLLLVLAALVTERLARARGLDPTWWSFLAVVTFGVAMLLAYRWRSAWSGHPQSICRDCHRIGDAREPFCFGCGAMS